MACRVPSKNEIRVGLIGAGYMGKCHAMAVGAMRHVYPDLPKLRPVSLCEQNQDVLSAAAQTGFFERYEFDWRDLIDRADIDLVIVATPNGLHRDVSVAALEKGINVLCEKPMALAIEDAEEMRNAAEKSSADAILGYTYVRNPAIKHIKKLIDTDAIGDITSFRGVFSEDYQADENNPHSWRCVKETAGLGALGDLGCHLISIAQYLLGDVSQLCGLTHIAYPRRAMPDDCSSFGAVTNEDAAYALLQFECGAPGVIESSRVAWGAKNRLEFEIQGSRGAIRFNQERMNEVEFYDAGALSSRHGFTTILSGPEHPPYGRFVPTPGHQIGFIDLKTIEIAEFVTQLSGGEKTGPDFEQGLKIERAIDAIATSSENRQWIDLASPAS